MVNLLKINSHYFETNKANISKDQQAELKELAAFMNVNPKLKLRIVGNSDDVGSSKYNERLSERRANSVYKFMTSDAGIAKERFEVVGVGENQPAVNPKVDKVVNGSTAFPKRLDIFCPFLSNTNPLDTTFLYATESKTMVPIA